MRADFEFKDAMFHPLRGNIVYTIGEQTFPKNHKLSEYFDSRYSEHIQEKINVNRRRLVQRGIRTSRNAETPNVRILVDSYFSFRRRES